MFILVVFQARGSALSFSFVDVSFKDKFDFFSRMFRSCTLLLFLNLLFFSIMVLPIGHKTSNLSLRLQLFLFHKLMIQREKSFLGRRASYRGKKGRTSLCTRLRASSISVARPTRRKIPLDCHYSPAGRVHNIF